MSISSSGISKDVDNSRGGTGAWKDTLVMVTRPEQVQVKMQHLILLITSWVAWIKSHFPKGISMASECSPWNSDFLVFLGCFPGQEWLLHPSARDAKFSVLWEAAGCSLQGCLGSCSLCHETGWVFVSWEHLGLSDPDNLGRSMCKADPADQTQNFQADHRVEIRCCCCVSLGPHLVLSVLFFKLQQWLLRAPKLTQTVRKHKDVTRHLQIAVGASSPSTTWICTSSLPHDVPVLSLGRGGFSGSPNYNKHT